MNSPQFEQCRSDLAAFCIFLLLKLVSERLTILKNKTQRYSYGPAKYLWWRFLRKRPCYVRSCNLRLCYVRSCFCYLTFNPENALKNVWNMFKVNNEETERHRCSSGFFFVKFVHILHLFLVFLLLTSSVSIVDFAQVLVCWT